MHWQRYSSPLFFFCLLMAACLHSNPIQPATPVTDAKIKKKVFIASGDPSSVLAELGYEYAPEGKLQKTSYYAIAGDQAKLQYYTLFEYTPDGLLQKQTQFVVNSAGSYLPELEIAYEYQQNQLSRETRQYNGQLAGYTTFQYQDNQLVQSNLFNQEMEMISYTLYEYDAVGNKTLETVYAPDGQVQNFTQYFFRNGRMVQSKEFGVNPARQENNLWRTRSFQYDSKGRLIFEKTEYVAPLISAIYPSIRIEYFD